MSSESADDSKRFDDSNYFVYNSDSEEDDPKSIIYRAGSPIDRTKSLEELREHVENLERKSRKDLKKQGYFMGFLTRKQAEKQITRLGQFATYYQLSNAFETAGTVPKDSIVALQLYVIYLDTHRRYRHFPIRKIVQPTKIFFQLGTSDAFKSSGEPIFFSIKNLLKHYTQFGYVESFTPGGGIHVEIFPKSENLR